MIATFSLTLFSLCLINDSHNFDLYVTAFGDRIADFDHGADWVDLLSAYSQGPKPVRSLYCHFAMCQFFEFDLDLPENLSKGRIEFKFFLKKNGLGHSRHETVVRVRNQKSYFTGVSSNTGMTRSVFWR